MRLIDADALKRILEMSPYNDYDDYLRTERLIDDAPTIEERPKGEVKDLPLDGANMKN